MPRSIRGRRFIVQAAVAFAVGIIAAVPLASASGAKSQKRAAHRYTGTKTRLSRHSAEALARAAKRRKPTTTTTTTTTTTPTTTTTAAPTTTTTTDPTTTTITPTTTTTTTTTDPTSTPPASTDPVPSTAPMHWNGDFSTGSWSQWDSANDDCRTQDHSIVTSPAAPSPFTFTSRHTVTPLSTLGQAGTRCFVYDDPHSDPTTGKSHAYEGAESWYQDYQYFPSDFVADPDTDWNWTWQIHNFPDGCSDDNITMGVNQSSSDSGGPHGQERLSMLVLGGGSAAHPCEDYNSGNWQSNPDIRHQWIVGPSIQRDRWYRIVVHAKWSLNPAVGLVEYYLDGRLLGTYHGPTLLYYRALSGAGQGYLVAGYYRSRVPTWDATVYHAGDRVYVP